MCVQRCKHSRTTVAAAHRPTPAAHTSQAAKALGADGGIDALLELVFDLREAVANGLEAREVEVAKEASHLVWRLSCCCL